MKTTEYNQLKPQNKKPHHAPVTLMQRLCFLMSLIAMMLSQANADTVMSISQPPARIFAAAGVAGVYPGYTNTPIAFTLTGDTNDIDLSVSCPAAGVTVGLSTNGTIDTIVPVVTSTNSINAYLVVSLTSGVAKGIYPITITASNQFNGLTKTVVSSLVVPLLWIAPDAANTNWSVATNWSTLAIPSAGDNVMFNGNPVTTPTTNAIATNILFDSSIALESLTYLPRYSSFVFNSFIGTNVTVSVTGTNGFAAGVDNFIGSAEKRVDLNIGGPEGTLVVSNSNANFALWDLAGSGGTKSTFRFNNLGKLYVDVNRFGGGDSALMTPNILSVSSSLGLLGGGGQVVDIFLARTNHIRATYVGDYSGYGIMTNSIMLFNNNFVNNGSAGTVNLGITNAIFADSIAVASHSAGAAGNTLRFNAAFIATNPVAYFRGANGGRMSFFGVGIDSGTNSGSPRTRGVADFSSGTVDMQVDTMWLGHNRTNFTGQNQQIGNLTYTRGVVDVNTLRAGYKQFPTTNFVQATVTVNGTNSTLVVNNVLELGYTTTDPLQPGDLTQQTFGRLNINSNAVARINTITVGTYSTNNQVVLTTGGHLIVSNTIASPDTALTALNVNGSKLTFHVSAGTTNAYVTNLVTGATVSTINIASLTGFSPTVPATNVLIKYQDSSASHNVSIGSIPAGYNNISLVDNLTDKTIELRIQTNAPATLKWRGGENSNWDHTSLNWQNTTTLATTRFFDGDSVIFDNSAVVPLTVNVTEIINPGQVGTGILVSNTTGTFTFAAAGGSIGNCALVKTAAGTIQIDCPTTAAVAVNQGTLTGSGSIGGTTIASGASLNFGGAINGALQVAGTATLASSGTINNTFTVQSTGVFTNNGTVQGGSMTLNDGATLFNSAAGTLLNIGNAGSVNVASNATLINVGNIGAALQANSLTVGGTFKDLGLGTIYLTTLTVNSGGTFLPGGDGIGISAILSPGVGSTFPGRVTLLTGSTTLIKVDFSNPQTNTIVKSQFQDFGANVNTKSFDGCTILVTNINTGAGQFALGQSFRMFQNSDVNITSGNIGNEGLNTTNRYPIIQPIIPVANTRWDLANLRDTDPNGFVNIIGFPTTGTNITYATFVADGTNLVSHLQWPSEYIGWSLQQQTNSLSVGISTNWTTVAGSSTNNDIYITNSVTTPASFFRMTYP